MKKMMICLSVLLVLYCFGFSYAKESQLSQESLKNITNEIVRPYFVALKSGDIETLKRFMAKEMYDEQRVLLEQNKEYPNFLKRIYRDANFTIGSMEETGNGIVVNTVIKYLVYD